MCCRSSRARRWRLPRVVFVGRPWASLVWLQRRIKVVASPQTTWTILVTWMIWRRSATLCSKNVRLADSLLCATRLVFSSTLSPSARARLRPRGCTDKEIFDRLDADGSGTLSKSELKVGLLADEEAKAFLGDDVETALTAMDLDGDDEITWMEFEEGFMNKQH